MTHETPTSASLPATITGTTAVGNGVESQEKASSSVPVSVENMVRQASEAVSEVDDPVHEHDETSDANEEDEGGMHFTL